MEIKRGKFDSVEFVVAGTETIAIDDVANVALTVPAGAVGAIVQVQTGGTGDVRFKVDGGAAVTGTTGFKGQDCAEICLGCVPSHEAPTAELANFDAIGTAGVVGNLEVLYYTKQ